MRCEWVIGKENLLYKIPAAALAREMETSLGVAHRQFSGTTLEAMSLRSGNHLIRTTSTALDSDRCESMRRAGALWLDGAYRALDLVKHL